MGHGVRQRGFGMKCSMPLKVSGGVEEEIDRCHREIAEIEKQLRAGHPDIAGLCLALADWSAELRILRSDRKKPPVSRRQFRRLD